MALGGRYDGVGAAFGRARPATGFSLDLRELCRLSNIKPVAEAIFAAALPASAAAAEVEARGQAIQMLRERGERVVDALPGECLEGGQIGYSGTPCDRQLVLMQGKWVVTAC